MITYQTRCGLCGQYVSDVDREALLEAHRFEWDEALVDEARTDQHLCVDSDALGARQWARLADSGMLRPTLQELVALALERRRQAGRPRWAARTSRTTTTTMALERHQVEDRGLLALDHVRTRVPVHQGAPLHGPGARGP